MPMRANVYERLKEIVADRKSNVLEVEPIIDGYSGFLFLNYRARKGLRPYIGLDIAHVARHTFCTKMVRQLMEPTRLQLIMGHSDTSVTLGYYTHTRSVDAKASLEEVDAKLKEDLNDFF